MLETVKMDARRNFNAELFDEFPAQRLLELLQNLRMANQPPSQILQKLEHWRICR